MLDIDNISKRQTSIILCCLGFVWLAGLHRFFRKDYISGIIWLATGGVFFIGTVIDLVNMIHMSDEEYESKFFA